jgi:peptidoglycan/LPS O-acetylase OafA/YrhL
MTDDVDQHAGAAPPRRHHFIAELESLRGIAAVTVAIFHSANIFPVDGPPAYLPTLWELGSAQNPAMRFITVLFNGSGAVALFFVLSGFVLAGSLARNTTAPLRKAWTFVLRRFLRIYPALAVNILLMSLLLLVFSPVISTRVTPLREIGQNLLLISFPINGATWSLMVELCVVPFLLAVHFAAQRFGTVAIVLLLAASLYPLYAPVSFAANIVALYAFMFVLGMLVAEIHRRWSPALGPRAFTVGLTGSIVVLLMARFVLGYGSPWALLSEGFASAAIIALVVTGPRGRVHDFLRRPMLRFLGRISYSYYLYHPLMLQLTAATLVAFSPAGWLVTHPMTGALITAVAVVILTVPLAWWSEVWIERPMARLGYVRRPAPAASAA